ncbi:uncharacterized protein UV8b_01981 [Ustilaginoidea virens]|uniref:2-deoxyglucose-6-phosphate phosphatase n=1 Tax=Ustilaginoidea virens TaxID=1159556 RepID=A0A8E5HLL4_USTVR|nr:uncharacterized protein UV8b_01981 [Ustilaginoidea virens]QUC17740.1 hypothetical protein UV8b_01981 [Ustilaginoidea virens]
MGSQPSFTQPPQRASFSGFLFDMDGTIIDSTAAIVKHWHSIATELALDPQEILKTSHGRRSIDVVGMMAPHKATWEYVKQVEGQIPLLYGDDAFEIAGARSLIDSLIALSAPWAIVTSGTEPLVSGWLSRLSLAVPRHLVTAESVADGKPDPACYRMGLDKLNLAHRAGDVVVLEDAPAGIEAGKAAGCKVIGLVTSHTVDQVVAAGPDWVVKDLESVRVVGQHDGRVTVEISNALRL